MKTKDEQLAMQEEQKIVEKQKEIKLAEKKRAMLLKKQALSRKSSSRWKDSVSLFPKFKLNSRMTLLRTMPL